MTDPHVYLLRVHVAADLPGRAVDNFLADLRELAVDHPGVEPYSVVEQAMYLPRVHQPPRHYDAGGRPAGRSTPWAR